MANATQSDRPILGPETTVQQALAWVIAGKVEPDTFAEWQADREKSIAAQAKASAGGPLRCKVSDKGCLSVYGLSARFPLSLYIGQWERLFAYREQIEAFAAEHAKELSRTKPVKPPVAA